MLRLILVIALIGGLFGFIFSGFRLGGFFSGFFETGWGCLRAVFAFIVILAIICLILCFL